MCRLCNISYLTCPVLLSLQRMPFWFCSGLRFTIRQVVWFLLNMLFLLGFVILIGFLPTWHYMFCRHALYLLMVWDQASTQLMLWFMLFRWKILPDILLFVVIVCWTCFWRLWMLHAACFLPSFILYFIANVETRILSMLSMSVNTFKQLEGYSYK